MPRQLLIDDNLFQTRLAVLDQGKLQHLAVEWKNQPFSIGDICFARVAKIDKNLDAAFLDLGKGQTGFLKAIHARQARHLSNQRTRPAKLKRADDIASLITEGEKFPVQIIKLAHGDKDVQVSTKLKFSGVYSLLNPFASGVNLSSRIKDEAARQRLKTIVTDANGNMDAALTIRSAAASAPEHDIAREISFHIECWETARAHIQKMTEPGLVMDNPTALHRLLAELPIDRQTEILIDTPLTEKATIKYFNACRPSLTSLVIQHKKGADLFTCYDIDSEIEQALSRTIKLPSGGSLVFDQTEALMAIDINSSQHVMSGSSDKFAFDVNREAVIEIARQIRLRNISGIILIDCLQMNNKQQAAEILQIFRDQTAPDMSPVHIAGFTSLGLIELSRKRQGLSLAALLNRPEAILGNILRACQTEIRSGGIGPIQIAATAEIIALLQPLTPVMEKELARQILLKQLDETGVTDYTLSFPNAG